jgi:hypothetical protein
MTTHAITPNARKLYPAFFWSIVGSTLIGSAMFAAYMTAFFSTPDSLSGLWQGVTAQFRAVFLPALGFALVLGLALYFVLTRLKRTSEHHYILGGALLAVAPAILYWQLGLPEKQTFGPTLDLAIVVFGGAAVGVLIAFVTRRAVRDVAIVQKRPEEDPGQ